MRFFACLCAVLASSGALAQVELVDPDAPAPKKAKSRPAAEPEGEDKDTAPAGAEAVDPDLPVKGGEDTGELYVPPLKRADAGVKAPKPKEVKKEAPPPPARKPPPALLVTRTTEADLLAAWKAWQKADASTDVKAEQDARAKLLALKGEIDAADVELWAVGLVRGSAAHEARGDTGGAVEIAVTASRLAPDQPAVWFGLAQTYFRADPSELGRFFGALASGLRTLFGDLRYSRATWADLGAMLFFGFLGVAIGVVGVLFFRRLSYFLYDFHFFFPRAAGRWQTAGLALIVLALPIVFRMGVAPALLVLFAAVALYVSLAERVVGLVLLALLGFMPTLGGLVVERTAFAGTPAEELYQLERGGLGGDAIAERFVALGAENKATFQHWAALGRYELRRGRLEAATLHLQNALNLRPNDARTSVNLGVAMMLSGDLENSRAVFEEAVKVAPDLAVAHFDLGRLFQRRLQVYGDTVAGETDQVTSELSAARRLDPSLAGAVEEPAQGSYQANAWARTLPLTDDDLLATVQAAEASERVRSQLSGMVLGEVPEVIAPWYPLLLALGLLGLGFLASSLGAAKACTRCGDPVSRRGDPEVSPGSSMCTQCVNVFAKKNVVAPALKVRKQLEVQRFQTRTNRVSYVLGLLFAGMGHVFAGLPIRGAAYGFLFVVALAGFFLRNGVLRPPFDGAPTALRLVPLTLVFVLVYALSLRGLVKRQGVK